MEQEKLQNHYGTQMVLGAKAETGCKGFPGINFTTTTTIFGKKNEIPFSKGEEAGSQKEQERREHQMKFVIYKVFRFVQKKWEYSDPNHHHKVRLFEGLANTVTPLKLKQRGIIIYICKQQSSSHLKICKQIVMMSLRKIFQKFPHLLLLPIIFQKVQTVICIDKWKAKVFKLW